VDAENLLAGPVVSDNGNFIIDAPFSRAIMEDPFTVGSFSLLVVEIIDTN
jgi:ribose 5-phosphate isomerase